MVCVANYRVLRAVYYRFLYERGHVATGESQLPGAQPGSAERGSEEPLPCVQAASCSAPAQRHSEWQSADQRHRGQGLRLLTVSKLDVQHGWQIQHFV